MHPLETQLRQFYVDFEQGRAEACIAQLHPQAEFYDHLIQRRQGPELHTLLRMLCKHKPGQPLDRRFTVQRVEPAGANHATVHWTAEYTFSATGRRLRNVITTPFEFEGGKIRRYEDRFDLYAWHRQAFGALGVLLGWTPLLTAVVRRGIAQQLARFRQREASAAAQ